MDPTNQERIQRTFKQLDHLLARVDELSRAIEDEDEDEDRIVDEISPDLEAIGEMVWVCSCELALNLTEIVMRAFGTDIDDDRFYVVAGVLALAVHAGRSEEMSRSHDVLQNVLGNLLGGNDIVATQETTDGIWNLQQRGVSIEVKRMLTDDAAPLDQEDIAEYFDVGRDDE